MAVPVKLASLRRMNQLLDVFSAESLVEMAAATPVTFNATSNTVTRSTGDWLAEGFLKGQTVLIAGSDAVLAGSPGVIIDAPTDSFTRDAGSWLAEGFIVGTVFAVTGSASNNATFTVLTVDALEIVTVEDITVSEGTQTDLTAISTTDNDGTLTIVNLTATVMTLSAVTTTFGEQIDVSIEVNSAGGQPSMIWAVGVRGHEAASVPPPLSCVIDVTGTITSGNVDLEYWDGHSWNVAVNQDTGLTALTAAGQFVVVNLQGVAFRLVLNGAVTADSVFAVVVASVPIFEVEAE